MNLPKKPFKGQFEFPYITDKPFIPVGKQLKTLIPAWYTPFCTLVKCAKGRYTSEQRLVLIECTTELDLNIFIFLTTKSNKESMYCEYRRRMFNFLNNSRQDYITLHYIIALKEMGVDIICECNQISNQSHVRQKSLKEIHLPVI